MLNLSLAILERFGGVYGDSLHGLFSPCASGKEVLFTCDLWRRRHQAPAPGSLVVAVFSGRTCHQTARRERFGGREGFVGYWGGPQE